MQSGRAMGARALSGSCGMPICLYGVCMFLISVSNLFFYSTYVAWSLTSVFSTLFAAFVSAHHSSPTCRFFCALFDLPLQLQYKVLQHREATVFVVPTR
eukprot:1566437-Pleurochrysis_carterae.AAC.3